MLKKHIPSKQPALTPHLLQIHVDSSNRSLTDYCPKEGALDCHFAFNMTAVNVALIRDTKWLTLEVCREFQRGTCSRADTECRFAHPPRVCHVENGRVVACFDSLKVSAMCMHISTSMGPFLGIWKEDVLKK